MNKRKRVSSPDSTAGWLWVFALQIVAGVVGVSSYAAAQATDGRKTWGRYEFRWQVQNSSGLSIQDVIYDGTYYLFNASMPVVRVQYDDDSGRCGPFMDRIGEDSITADAEGNLVRFAEKDDKLYVTLKAQISAYALEQQWIFHRWGRIDARLFSSGLQCTKDHRHHPYWRIDPDIAEPGFDEIRVRYADGRVLPLTTEANLRKSESRKISWWSFRDATTRHQLLVIPGRRDGTTDSFAGYDFYARAFHEPWEQEPWASDTGALLDKGDLLLQSADGEPVGPGSDTIDTLGWYVAHLSHAASTGSTQTTSVGPTLLLLRPGNR